MAATAPDGCPGKSRAALSLDVGLIIALVALAATIRIWLICHTEVPARDGIGFIRYAWQLRYQPWQEVLRENPHPPFYPLTILAVSWPVRHLIPGPESFRMQLSAQLASAAAGVLLVMPMYFLGKRLFDRRVAFWATALFQCLPVGSRALSDALSEGIFLLLIATTLLLVFQAFERLSPGRFALCGVFGGLAYLTRPEGALIVLAIGVVLLGLLVLERAGPRYRPLLTCLASLGIGALAVSLPYMATIGHITNKTTGMEILSAGVLPKNASRLERPVASANLMSSLAVYWSDAKHFQYVERLGWSLTAVIGEILRGFHYIGWLPTVLALYWYGRSFFPRPGAWVIVLLCVFQALVLWRVAFVAGYVAERHSLVFILCGGYYAVAGILALGPVITAFMKWLIAKRGMEFSAWPGLAIPWVPAEQCLSLILLLGMAGFGLPKTLEPLHAVRAGYHAAGLWLAEHATANDQIVDPFCWSEYYAGQVLRKRSSTPNPVREPERRFVVIGGSENDHKRLPLIPEAEKLASHGTIVFHWPTQPVKTKAEAVEIYCVDSKTGG